MKYRLTDETMEWEDHTLHRIEALKDFGNVKAGDKGGWIEKEENLSQNGDCWVYDDAIVCDDANVRDNAVVRCNAKISGKADIFGNAVLYDNASVFDYARVFNDAEIYEDAEVCGESEIYENAEIFGNAVVDGHSIIYGKAKVFGDAEICGAVEVYGHARVYGSVVISSYSIICGFAKISDIRDYIVFKNWWSDGIYFTWTRSNNMWKVGEFYGTGEELIAKAYKDSPESGREYERVVRYVESIINEDNHD